MRMTAVSNTSTLDSGPKRQSAYLRPEDSGLAAGYRLVIIGLVAAFAIRQLIRLANAPWMASPSSWTTADPVEAIVFVVWALALGSASWLLFSVVLVLAARQTGSQALEFVTHWATIPAVRRLAGRVTAVSLVVTTLATPTTALAQQTPPMPVIAVMDATEESGAPPPTSPKPERSTPASVPILPARVIQTNLVDPPRPEPLTVGIQSTADEPASSRTHVVAPGENLWAISHDTLHAQLERTPSDQEITSYWVALINSNQPNLRSGNPDLIFPGESIELPERP